jgi:uncharacterized membrane-anchored protein
MNDRDANAALSKVPEVTLAFWIIKIAATTLGETGGDSVTMTLNWGYLVGTAIFLCLLVLLVAVQIRAQKFHPVLYWATIVASTTFGTTMADFADRSLGIGYSGGSSLLFVCLMIVLGLWYRSEGTIAVDTVRVPRVEAFYWAAITFSQTLGTALGDWMADTGGLGYEGGALVFAAGLAAVVAFYLWSRVSRVVLFWAAWRLPRQTKKSGRVGLQPAACLRDHRRFHHRLPACLAAARRAPPHRIDARVGSAPKPRPFDIAAGAACVAPFYWHPQWASP